MPVVVTEPLIDLSAPTVMVPAPAAAVVTGGTSAAPPSFRFICCASAPVDSASAAAAAMIGNPDLRSIANVLMANPSSDRG